jgi:hypothetical protein
MSIIKYIYIYICVYIAVVGEDRFVYDICMYKCIFYTCVHTRIHTYIHNIYIYILQANMYIVFHIYACACTNV